MMFSGKEVAVGLGVPIGASTAAIAGVHYFVAAPDVGDLLSFIGALSGAAMAIAGAIYVEERRRTAAARDEQAPVIDALKSMRVAIARMSMQTTIGTLDDGELESARSVLARIFSHFPPKTAARLVARDHLDAALARLDVTIRDEKSRGAYYPGEPPIDELAQGLNLADAYARQLIEAHSTTR